MRLGQIPGLSTSPGSGFPSPDPGERGLVLSFSLFFSREFRQNYPFLAHAEFHHTLRRPYDLDSLFSLTHLNSALLRG